MGLLSRALLCGAVCRQRGLPGPGGAPLPRGPTCEGRDGWMDDTGDAAVGCCALMGWILWPSCRRRGECDTQGKTCPLAAQRSSSGARSDLLSALRAHKTPQTKQGKRRLNALLDLETLSLVQEGLDTKDGA